MVKQEYNSTLYCIVAKYETALQKCKTLEYSSNLSAAETDVERTSRHDRCKKVVYGNESPVATGTKTQSKTTKSACPTEVLPVIAVPQTPTTLLTSMYGKALNTQNMDSILCDLFWYVWCTY
jgi:hypothetical protein